MALEQVLSTYGHLGVPVSAHKMEGTTQLTFLDIQIDMEAMFLSLAPDKLGCILLVVLA
jgi:hypothetical protein